MNPIELVVSVFTNIVSAFLSVPPEVYVTILGAGVVSVIVQILKKVLKLDSEKVVVTVFAAVAFAASGLEYLITAAELSPMFLGANTALLMGIATPLYRFVIKPLSLLISQYKLVKEPIEQKLDEIEAIAVPADVVQTAEGATLVTEQLRTDVVVGITNSDIPANTVAVVAPVEKEEEKEVVATF